MKGDILKNLKETFTDGVYIRHDEENLRTIGIIVNGLNVHVGISKRHPDDQLNRAKGRTIALGRAKRAYDVFNGTSQLRARDEMREEPLFFTLPVQSTEIVQQAVDDLITGRFFE